MVLVNTALGETFPKDKTEKILFLGEWCKLYSKKDIYEEYDYETMLYHWDDRKKLYEDTKYIDNVYEKYLELLKDNLNTIHNVNFSISYWRIILGPWLRYFIEMLYDRYLSIKNASKKDISYVKFINIKDQDIVPCNMQDFVSLYPCDLWNQYIYQNILQKFDIKIKNINGKCIKEKLISNRKVSFKNKIKNALFFLNKFNKIHFFSPYIKLKKLMLLQIKLGQIPTIGSTIEIELDVDYSSNLRNLFEFLKTESEFENILQNLIKKQIPKYYLEGYKDYRNHIIKKYPKSAELVFTANSYAYDDTFKFWIAEKKEGETEYIIGQHGGNHGMGLFASHEKHQIDSSSKFFSWGWSLMGSSKVIPLSAPKLNNKINSNPKGCILIPLASLPRYSYHIMAMPIAGQILSIIDDQLDYLKLVSDDLKKLLRLRIYPKEHGWDFKKRFIDLGYEDCIDSQYNLNKSFYKRLSECRLCIATYNSTTYLETFSANYPTLLYWNQNQWELNDEAKPYFELLENTGILHYTAKSLLYKLNDIYDDPLSWWLDTNIQNAKNLFCNRFANVGDSSNDFISIIKTIQ